MHESDTYLAILDEGQEKATREDILVVGEERIPRPRRVVVEIAIGQIAVEQMKQRPHVLHLIDDIAAIRRRQHVSRPGRAQQQYAELDEQIAQLARKVRGHDELLDEIMRALEALAAPPPSPSRPIGFRTPTDDQRPSGNGDGSAQVSPEPNAGRASE